MRSRWFACGVVLLTLAADARACSICSADLQNRLTWRQDAKSAKLVLFGTLANPRLSAAGTGQTDLVIEKVLADHPIRAERKTITLPRYVPFTAGAPPKYLVYCEVYNGQLDPYRGTPVQSVAAAEYLTGALAIPEADIMGRLLYSARFLDAADPEVSFDAFLEFAKANDREVALAAAKLQPAAVRKLLLDPKTPADRLGVFAYLLGACGGPDDAKLLLDWLTKPTDRTRQTFSGQLAGYIQLRPREGGDFLLRLLQDAKAGFAERLAAVGTLRFLHGCKPEENKPLVLSGLEALIKQGELADLAVQDLTRWQYWELTPRVLAVFRQPGYEPPLVTRAIARYALLCPRPEAAEFVKRLRSADAKLVEDIESGLKIERPGGP